MPFKRINVAYSQRLVSDPSSSIGRRRRRHLRHAAVLDASADRRNPDRVARAINEDSDVARSTRARCRSPWTVKAYLRYVDVDIVISRTLSVGRGCRSVTTCSNPESRRNERDETGETSTAKHTVGHCRRHLRRTRTVSPGPIVKNRYCCVQSSRRVSSVAQSSWDRD